MVNSAIETLSTAKGYWRDHRLSMYLCTSIAAKHGHLLPEAHPFDVVLSAVK